MTTTTDWAIRIDWDTPPDTDTDAAAGWLVGDHHADSAAFGPVSIDATFTIDADTYSQAYERAVELTHLGDRHGWTVAAVIIQRGDRLDDELARPPIPALAGISEASELLGVSKQRAHALSQQPGFPPAVALLASGPVFLRSSIEAFSERRQRRSGRPSLADALNPKPVAAEPQPLRLAAVGTKPQTKKKQQRG